MTDGFERRERVMTAHDVYAFLDLMEGLGIRIWLDGGWAVDACPVSYTHLTLPTTPYV